jgi:hypothetical protein
MSAIASLSGFSLSAPTRPLPVHEGSTGYIPGLKRFVIDDLYVVGINESTGMLASYSCLEPEELPVTRKEPMSKEEALTLAKRFLDAVGIDRNVQDATVGYGNASTKSANWSIRFYDRVNGIRCLSGVYINVAAFSDRIIFFREHPLLVPDSMEQKVTAQQAAETAIQFAAKQQPTPLEVKEEPELVIILMSAAPRGEGLDMSDKTRLCWEVRLKYKSNDQNVSGQQYPPTTPMFFVDTITGEVIAGSL